MNSYSFRSESSYFLVRLLQRIDRITLAPDAQPPETRPPSHWKEGIGRQTMEQFWLKSHLTMYAAVSTLFLNNCIYSGIHTDVHKGGLWVRMSEAADMTASVKI